MKEVYKEPEVEVVLFGEDDVIVTSNELPFDWFSAESENNMERCD